MAMNTKRMKGALVALAASASLALVACGGDDTKGSPGTDAGGDHTTGNDATPDQGGGDVNNNPDANEGGGPPAPPTLGTQVDRFGRPAINTALNHTFDANAGTKGTAKDAYNADVNSATWTATYKAEFAKNLAIYDGLDTVCGNQLGAGPNAVAGRYDTLAGALAADTQWLNTGSTTCTLYLGVELNALGVASNTDCGGRTLKYDVIDETYSAVAIGKTTGVTDGIDADPTKTGGATFPYLAAAQ
jgi:hypothetical protein